jgi:cation diffusion facilitator family transporter
VFATRERRTRFVVVLSALTMLGELLVGWWTHSLALVADGWHMASHVGALGLAWVAYAYCRRVEGKDHRAVNQAKVLAVAGYTNAMALGFVGIAMIWEAFERLADPSPIAFAQAIPVAAIGLAVNVVSALVLHEGHHHDHAHVHHDHNFKAAYVHIIADAATSVMALAALLAARAWGTLFLDPLCAAVGGVVVIVWAAGLAKQALRDLVRGQIRTTNQA